MQCLLVSTRNTSSLFRSMNQNFGGGGGNGGGGIIDDERARIVMAVLYEITGRIFEVSAGYWP